MANVTGIDLNPILQRLNSTSNYHPFDAETFSDWATEAGDMVTISRNGENYSSPIHTSRMVWKGKAPTMQVSTSGNEKRDAVSRVSRKKYGRGSAGIRSQEGIHREFYSEDGILHSELHVTESYLRTEFHDETNSLRSYFDMTASHMRTEFLDEVHSLRSEFEVTASHLRTEFEDDVNSLRGEFEVTASHLRTEFEDDVNSLRGEFEVTASHLRTEFEDDVNSLRGEFEVTASHLRTEFDDDINSLRGEFEVTASHLRTEFTDEVHSLRGEFEITASHLRTEFEDDVNSVRSYMRQTASSWEARVEGVTDENGNITAASIAVAVNAEGSQARINADRIYLLGQTIADTIDADYIDSTVANIPILHGMSASFTGSIRVGSTLYLGSDPTDLSGNVANAIKELRIQRNGNTYTLQKKDFNDSDWEDVDSFSRATTLSGAWSGRRFTATASPQGDELYTDLWSAVPAANVTWDGTIATLNLYATLNGGETTYNAGPVTVNIASFLQDKTGTTKKFTANGLYSADSGYVGFGNIEIDVPQSTVDPTTLSIQWNGSRRLNANASPQGVSRYTTIVSSIPNSDITFSGTTLTLPLKATYDGGETTVAVGNVTANISGKLQTKTISENGTVNPDSGYIGFGSVTVAVPTTNASARFGAGDGSYFIEAYDRTSGTSITGSSVTYKLAKSGNKVQIQNTSSVQLSNTPEYDMSTDLTNAGYAGRANVTLNDPTWNPVTGATPDYRTVTVTTTGRTNASGTTDNLSKSVALYLTQGSWSSNQLTVFMRAGGTSGTVYASTTVDASTLVSNAGYAGRANVTLNDPTWNPVTGATPTYRTVTVATSGRTNASGTTDNLSKSVALYLTQGSWSSNQLTVFMRAGGTSGTVYASTTVDASTLVSNATTAGYKSGWEAYYNKWRYPAVGTNAGMTVYWPKKDVDSAYDSISRTYTIQNKDYNTVYLRYNNQTYAEFAHNKYDAGWGGARGKLSVPISQATAQSLVIKFPASTVGNQTSQTYYVTEDNTYAYIRAGTSNGTVVARVSNSAYGNGWTNAYNQIVFPSNNTSSASMTLKTTSSAVGGTAATTTYNLVVDDNVAYIKDGNNVKAQVTHNKYKNGFNADHTIWLVEHSCATNAVLNLSGAAHRYSIRYDYKNDNNQTVEKWVGTSWEMPGVWLDYTTGTADQGTLAAGSIIGLKQTNYDGTTRFLGKWQVPQGGSTSHSVSVSSQNIWHGQSKYDVLDRMGISSFSYEWGIGSGSPYWGFKASCGGSTKSFLVYRA